MPSWLQVSDLVRLPRGPFASKLDAWEFCVANFSDSFATQSPQSVGFVDGPSASKLDACKFCVANFLDSFATQSVGFVDHILCRRFHFTR